MYRPAELEQYKNIWLTKESYEFLREEKTRLKKEGIEKSMAKILDDLIKLNNKQRV
jgi:hypothetical protein